MSWKFNDSAPIYLQIMDEIKLRIAKGILKPGDKVPAVRELAVTAGVNPNTMQKALSELEREGVLYSNRTAGRFVAENNEGADDMKMTIVEKYISECLKGLRELGYEDNQILDMIQDKIKEGKMNE